MAALRKKTASKPRPGAKPKLAPTEGLAASDEPLADAELVEEEREPSDKELLEENVEEVVALVPAKPARSTELTRRDPLSTYLDEISRHPLLTREEELSLALQYSKTGDVKAAYRLVASNLRLVVKLANEYHRNPFSLLDLIQEGNIGLMQAVKKYDPHRGVKLSSYAAWWIRAYILRYIMDNWKMVKLGTTEAQRKLFFKLRQEQERLLAQGIEITPKLLAERLDVTEQDVREMDLRLGHDEVSIDAPIGPDNEAPRIDRLLPNHAAQVDDRLGQEELKRLFKEKLEVFAKTLEAKDRYIFEKRLIAEEPITLQEIGEHYGVSRERARQIESALIHRMREYMRQEIPDFDLVAVPKG